MAAGATTCATPPSYSNPSIPTTPTKMEEHTHLNEKVIADTPTPSTVEGTKGTGIGLFGYNGVTQNGDTAIGKSPVDLKVSVYVHVHVIHY